MRTTLTPTRRGVLYLARRALRIALLKFLIWSDESMVDECDPDGVLQSESLRLMRLRLQELRVELAIEERS